MKYSIGNHIVEIEGAELVDAVAALNSFKPFITDDGGKAVVQFSYEGNLSNAEFALAANGKFLYSSENDGVLSELYELGGDRYLQRMRRSGKEFRGTGCCYDDELYQVVDRSGGRAAIYGTLDLQMLRFALWIGYGILTSNLKTIAIHSSCIVYRGKAVIFLGESGTGKSTHTRLWRENIMGASLLNDDSPIIRIGEGVEVYGSPWSGKTPCYRQEVYPLAAIVRLYQAPFNKIEKLPVLGAYGALHPSCPPDFAYSADLYDGISSTIGKILERVPVYMMGCLPDADAARTSCEKIFG
ncbi:MAG: hypothetical protein IKY70_07275 [Bacteroidales bacterium]|nr:hypothetical protein [Bacteroidales bacterium]